MTRSFVGCYRGVILMLLGLAVSLPAPLAAQEDTVTVVAGPEYEAGRLQAYLFGEEYRALWTTPIQVPVLDLDTFAGGLTPVERGGGVQTMALRFEGEDGREYNFRSVNKELTPSLPPDARHTLVDWIRQDVTSAQHPASPLIATPLLDAVGILNPGPQLVVLPDVPALGEFREDYGGLLGTIELHANEGDDDQPLFGSTDLEPTDEMFAEVRETPDNRADSRAFLASRLMSLFLGDWDRHGGQYRWASYDRDGVIWWVPVPEDRDYAFVDYDGLLLDLAQMRLPRLVEFNEDYQDLMAMMANSLDLNRRLLAPLPRSAWDSVATALRAQLTDEVIERAVRQQPPEYFELSGEVMIEKLKARRDQLPALAARYYRLMAQNVEIHGTDEEERAEIERNTDGTLEVRLYAEDSEWGDDPYYERTFHPDETEEIRLFLYGGDDEAAIRGEGGGNIVLRVIGGKGDDELQDFTRGPTVIYDAEGNNEILGGSNTRIDERPYEPEEAEAGLIPEQRRDWGAKQSLFTPWVGWRSNVGIVVGGGPTWTQYGFRHDPYASRMGLRAFYALDENRVAVEYTGDFRLENSNQHVTVLARGSNMEATRFHGFGNLSTDEGGEDRYVVWQKQLRFEPTWHFSISPEARFSVGPVVQYTDPDIEEGTPAAVARPFGTEATGQIGGQVRTRVDLRDSGARPGRGAYFDAGVAAFSASDDDDDPEDGDDEDLFARARAEASAYFTLPVLNQPTLALRAGGEQVWGRFPFYEAAFVGGSGTLRGFLPQRYAGEAAVYGTAELRLPLAYIELLTRGDLGITLLADAGRVYMDGESPGGWHTATGAGIWFASLGQVFSVHYAHGELDALYLRMGMPF